MQASHLPLEKKKKKSQDYALEYFTEKNSIQY